MLEGVRGEKKSRVQELPLYPVCEDTVRIFIYYDGLFVDILSLEPFFVLQQSNGPVIARFSGREWGGEVVG